MNVKFQSEHVRVQKLTPKPVYICTIFKHLHFFSAGKKFSTCRTKFRPDTMPNYRKREYFLDVEFSEAYKG